MDDVRNFNMMVIRIYLKCIYKQPVYKQLALGWQITKQFSGPNPLSLSNNKNYRLKKKIFEFFLCSLFNKRKIAVKPTIHQNSASSKAFIGKILKSLMINIDFES